MTARKQVLDAPRSRLPQPTTANGQVTRASIRAAAVRLFRERGYEATSLRELAADVGIEAASLYNHFPSKQVLLADILISVMEELVEAVDSASAATVSESPAQRMRAVITAYVLMHENRLDEALITDTERRSLQPADAKRLLQLRTAVSTLIRGIIDDGANSGQFVVPDSGIAALAVLSICSRLAVWYQPGGRLTLPEIAALVCDFCLRALGATPEAERR